MGSLRHAMEHIQLATDGPDACSVVIISADVLNKGDVDALFGMKMDPLPDIVINNAGVSGSQRSIVESRPDEWWREWVSRRFVRGGSDNFWLLKDDEFYAVAEIR